MTEGHCFLQMKKKKNFFCIILMPLNTYVGFMDLKNLLKVLDVGVYGFMIKI